MASKYFIKFLIVLLLGLVVGCVKVPPQDNYFVSETLEERINSTFNCNASISDLLQDEISADLAVQIALLNNPSVQANLQELGISHADLLEASLLPNPFFELEVRYPTQKHLKTNIEYLITSSLVDLFLVRLRTDLANTEYEQIKLQVTNHILNLAFQVRETYYKLIGEKIKVHYLESLVQLNSISLDLSSQQLSAGNINSLEMELFNAQFLEIELELARSKASLIASTQTLNRLLGFTEEQCLHLPTTFNDLDLNYYNLCDLENFALENRLDLQVANLEIYRIAQMLGLKDSWTYTNLKLGLAGEREPDGANLVGLGIAGELPIFNYGQAARLRLYAQLRQAQEQYQEVKIKALADVRKAYQLQLTYLSMVEKYQSHLLPLQKQIIASAEGQYNVMGLGIDRLLEQKRRELHLLINYYTLLTDYQISKVQLDQALGWGLSL